MKYLLLQARNPGDPAGPHEYEAFRDEMQLAPDALIAWDLLSGRPPERLLDEVDCVLVGGSGEYGVNDTADNHWLTAFIDLMGDLAADGFPTFASCFGFQALVVAGGGSVATDKQRAEVGTFRVFTTDEGAADDLFATLAPEFLAQFGHKDHVTVLPAGMINLARSERSPYQALKIPGKPVYATQFHPELSMVRNRERFLRYLEAYSQPDMVDTPETVLANYRETRAATALLGRFVQQVLEPLKAEG